MQFAIIRPHRLLMKEDKTIYIFFSKSLNASKRIFQLAMIRFRVAMNATHCDAMKVPIKLPHKRPRLERHHVKSSLTNLGVRTFLHFLLPQRQQQHKCRPPFHHDSYRKGNTFVPPLQMDRQLWCSDWRTWLRP